MANRVMLNLDEWFGAALKVHIRKDLDVTSLTIPDYLSHALHLKDKQTLQIYIKKQPVPEVIAQEVKMS